MPTTCSVNSFVQDTFIGSGALQAHTPDLGGAWSGAASISLSSNKAFSIAAGNSIAINATVITGNVRVARATINNANASSNGVDLAMVGLVNASGDGYFWGFEGNKLVIKKLVAGTLLSYFGTDFTTYSGVFWDLAIHISYAGANPVINTILFDSVSQTLTDNTSPVLACNKLALYVNGVHTLTDGYQFGNAYASDGLDFVGIVGDANGSDTEAGSGNGLVSILTKRYKGTAILSSAAGGNSTIGNARLNQVNTFGAKLNSLYAKRKLIVTAGSFDIANAANQPAEGNNAFSALIALNNAAKALAVPFNEVWACQILPALGPTSGGLVGRYGVDFDSGRSTYNAQVSSSTVLTGFIAVPTQLATNSTVNYTTGPNAERVYLNASGIITYAAAIETKAQTCVTTGTGTGQYTQADLDAAVASAVANARIGYILQANSDAAVANAIVTARVGYVTASYAVDQYQQGYSAGVAAQVSTGAGNTVNADIIGQLAAADAAGYARGLFDGKIRRKT